MVTVLRVRDATDRLLSGWLFAFVVGQVVAFGVIWRLFVGTRNGQRLDTIALGGNTIGHDRIDGLVSSVLDAMSIAALVFATVAIGMIALMRGRAALALVATLFLAGANASVQLLKLGIDRPDFGVDPERAAAGNSLPSGHTAVAASFAVALVLVLPPRLRGAGAIFGAGYAALVGVATLSEGWHRPSDAVAAILVVGAWAAVTGLLLTLLRQRAQPVMSGGTAAGGGRSIGGGRVAGGGVVGGGWVAGSGQVVGGGRSIGDGRVGDGQAVGGELDRDGHQLAVRVLVFGGVALLAAAGIGLAVTSQVLAIPPDALSRRRLGVAFAGSAFGIAGTACLVMALVVATVHRVVPRRG